ncbi:MAG: SusC/RagA family TonB-linked outer membrane protein [Muricauda sp.]|nr:SusC/RagA family TonB-linked outer membrane protein [Allomuricauda sp.]MBA4745702.1 SusC/RagA family TonB-linked outer membrane protein [Allomuricauda sp.]
MKKLTLLKKEKLRKRLELKSSLCFIWVFLMFSNLDAGVTSISVDHRDFGAFNYQVTVTGTVVDSQGAPLPGATVIEKGTSNGTQSDFDGNFSIQVSDPNAILVVSYIGFREVELPLEGKTELDITLSEDTAKLDEVVVVGYGSLQKKEITSAVASVSTEDFNQGNVFTSEQLLQGKVAGLDITKAGSDLNQPFSIRLRGVSTLGANSTPLIVIDGVIGGNLDLVDPNDIASIDVLKDASAAAIYGTRGSAGVILVTTKKGSYSEKATLNYSSYVSFDEPLNDRRIRPATAEENIRFGGVDFGSNTNFEDEILRTGVSNVHNLSFSRNNGSTNYRASINYRDIGGTLVDQGFEQLNARINISQNFLDDKLTLGSIVSVTKREINYSNPAALRHASTFSPTAPVYINDDPQQGYFETFIEQQYNPVAMIKLNPHLGVRKNFLGNFKLDYKPITGLNLGMSYSIQSTNEQQGVYSYSNSRAGAEATNGRARRSSYDQINELFEATGTYTGETDDWAYTALLGYSYQTIVDESFSVENTDFITNELTFNNLDIGNGFRDPEGVRATASNKQESLLASFFGRINLTFKDNYYLSASYRREGSSKFGQNNRWGNFWALSGGAELTDLFKIKAFNSLKMRVGYGVTGNLPSQNYAYLPTLGAIPGQQGYVDGSFLPAIQPTSNPNPDLKWEEKGELNVGIDFALMDYRISGSVDYYKRNTKDLLNVIDVPSPPNLFNQSLVNLGELESNGFEVQINFQAINKADFNWEISANAARNVTKLIKFNNDIPEGGGLLRGEGIAQNGSYAAYIQEGERIGNIIAPTFAGYNSEGLPYFLDEEGNRTTDNQEADIFTVQGNGLPDLTAGIANTFRYKNWDLNFFFRGAFGHDIANGRRARYEHAGYVGIQNPVITDGFTEEDKGLLVWHSLYVEDASFVKLDNATLGYTIPLSDNSVLQKLRLYISGQNLFVITNYLGSDPEVRYLDRGRGIGRTPGFSGNPQYGGDILVPGIDRWELGQYPNRTITLGVNISL